MKTSLLIAFLFLSSFKLTAQNVYQIKGPIIVGGVEISKKDTITIGSPTLKSSEFKYIEKPFNNLTSEREEFLKAKFSSEKFLVKGFKEGMWHRRGFRQFIIITIDKSDFYIDAELAVASGELILPKREIKSISTGLEKLSELYKDGLLTDEEFKAAKAKLLNP